MKIEYYTIIQELRIILKILETMSTSKIVNSTQ